MQADAFLKEHEVYDFTVADFEQDREALLQLRATGLSTEPALDVVVVTDRPLITSFRHHEKTVGLVFVP